MRVVDKETDTQVPLIALTVVVGSETTSFLGRVCGLGKVWVGEDLMNRIAFPVEGGGLNIG